MTGPWQVIGVLLRAATQLTWILAGMACRIMGVLALTSGVIRAWFAWQGEGIAEIGPPSWSAASFQLVLGITSYALPELVRDAWREPGR